jgi:hypothetical protein
MRWILLSLSIVFSSSLLAQESERIDLLEKRIKVLEDLLIPADSKAKTIAPKTTLGGWQNPSSWQKLKRGMSFGQVEEILGRPTTDAVGSRDYGKWYYEGNVNGSIISGNVSFYSRQVSVVFRPIF